MWNKLLFLLALPLAAQTIVPSYTTVTYAGSRPTMDQTANPKCYFDSKYTLTNTVHFKSDGSTPLYTLYQTNCSQPTTAQDGGSIAKVDIIAPARAASGGPIPDDASVGNPDVSPDGTLLIFLVQTATNAAVTSPYTAYDPGGGYGYILYGCKLPCSSTSTAIISQQGTPTGAVIVGGLDPHFFAWDTNKVFWSTQQKNNPAIWPIVTITVDWSGAAPVTTGPYLHGTYRPGNFASYVGATTGCDEYNKATGATRNPATGVVTMYVQSDQIPMGTGMSTGYGSNGTNPCYLSGATLRQSGIIKFDLDGTLSGTNWQIVYPLQPCNVINGEYPCYAEFPTPIPTTTSQLARLVFLCNQFSTRLGWMNLVNEANEHDDWCVVNTDGSGLAPITNFDNPGTPLYTSLAVGGLAASAHAAINPYLKKFVVRIVSGNGMKDRVILFNMDGPGMGIWPTTVVTGTFSHAGALGVH